MIPAGNFAFLPDFNTGAVNGVQYATRSLKLIHEGVPEEMHDECVKGWNESLDKLDKNIK